MSDFDSNSSTPLPPHSIAARPSDAYIIPPPHPFFGDLDAATPRVLAVPTLIAINFAIYLVMGFRGVGWIEPSGTEMLHWGVDFWPLTTSGEWWRLLTSAFIHFGILHIAFNMWALYAIGYLTERLFGTTFFLLLYLLCAVISGLTSVWPLGGQAKFAMTAGASGAVFAIYGGLLAYLLVQARSFPSGAVQKLLKSTLFFIVINIYIGFKMTGISNSAHLGGLASGVLIGSVLARPLNPQRRRRQTLPRFAIGTLLGVGLIAAGIAFIPKCSLDLLAAQRLHDLRPTLANDDAAAAKSFDAVQAELEAGKLTPASAADRVETDVVPLWTAMLQRLGAARVPQSSSKFPLYATLTQYCQLRHDAAVAYVAAQRKNDPKQATVFEVLSIKATQLEKPLQTLLDADDKDFGDDSPADDSTTQP